MHKFWTILMLSVIITAQVSYVAVAAEAPPTIDFDFGDEVVEDDAPPVLGGNTTPAPTPDPEPDVIPLPEPDPVVTPTVNTGSQNAPQTAPVAAPVAISETGPELLLLLPLSLVLGYLARKRAWIKIK